VTPAAQHEQFRPFGRVQQHLRRPSFHHPRADLDLDLGIDRLGEDHPGVVLVVGHIGGRDQPGADRDLPGRHRLYHRSGQFRLVNRHRSAALDDSEPATPTTMGRASSSGLLFIGSSW
jgi:hypothetical protein